MSAFERVLRRMTRGPRKPRQVVACMTVDGGSAARALPAAVHRFVNNAGIGFDKLTGFPDCRSVVVVVEEAEKQGRAEVDTWAAHSAHPLNPFCFLLVRISSRVCQGPYAP